MNNNIYRTMLGGMIILNMFGFFMDAVWIQKTGSPGFFGWDIRYRGHIPFWLLANIIFIAVTLITAFFLTGARFHLTLGHGNNNSKLSFKLIGVNLI